MSISPNVPPSERIQRSRTLTTRKGRSVETPYTDEQALTALRALIGKGKISGDGFAGDLSLKAATKRGLSDEQWIWVHILVVEAEAKTQPAFVESFPILRAWFNKAAEHLKTPKLAVEVGGDVVKIKRAGDQSRYPGFLFVDNGRGFNERGRVYYGKVDTDGVFHPTRNCPRDVVDTLRAIEHDPTGFAVEYGKRTGNCCFCNRLLETAESLAVGYGPVCASHWGLPWGNKSDAFGDKAPAPECDHEWKHVDLTTRWCAKCETSKTLKLCPGSGDQTTSDGKCRYCDARSTTSHGFILKPHTPFKIQE